jgi:hypothetical protein
LLQFKCLLCLLDEEYDLLQTLLNALAFDELLVA